MMKPEDMPAPDAVIDYGNGEIGPAMFHYATEGYNARHIARDCGFDVRFVHMEVDSGAPAELLGRHETGENVLPDWKPPVIDGWTFTGKTDTEDGPMALYLRPLEAKGEAA